MFSGNGVASAMPFLTLSGFPLTACSITQNIMYAKDDKFCGSFSYKTVGVFLKTFIAPNSANRDIIIVQCVHTDICEFADFFYCLRISLSLPCNIILDKSVQLTIIDFE